MFVYEKRLQHPVRIKNPNPKLAKIKLTLDNDTFENTGKSRFFERRTSRVLY